MNIRVFNLPETLDAMASRVEEIGYYYCHDDGAAIRALAFNSSRALVYVQISDLPLRAVEIAKVVRRLKNVSGGSRQRVLRPIIEALRTWAHEIIDAQELAA